MRPWYTFLAEVRAADAACFGATKGDVPNPWMLTDPAEAQVRQADPKSVRQLAEFWSNVSDVRSAFWAVWELRQALWRRQISVCTPVRTTDPPWPTVYRVRRDITLGGIALARGDELTVGVQSVNGKTLVRLISRER